MVVDDDALVRRTLSLMLEASGYRVEATEDGLEAQAAVERGEVDLVILDVMMPKLCGLEVCRRIKSTPSGRLVPVVLLTAYSDTDEVIAGLNAGADDFLKKPIEPTELEARVRAILRFKRSQRDATAPNPDHTLPELIAARVRDLSDKARLSPREREALDLLLLGRSMDEIAVALEISPRTAKFHQANVLRKLGAESRLELLRLLL
jgi:DNA-binding response OmpR family regulator